MTVRRNREEDSAKFIIYCKWVVSIFVIIFIAQMYSNYNDDIVRCEVKGGAAVMGSKLKMICIDKAFLLGISR